MAIATRERKNGNKPGPAGIGDNQADVALARENLRDLGSKLRLAEAGILKAQDAAKATKSESMKAFALHAEAGIINLKNFDEFYLVWRYDVPPADGKVGRNFGAEASRFRKVVKAALDQKELGGSFVKVIDGITKQVETLTTAAKADKALIQPKQADQAVYAAAMLATESEDENGKPVPAVLRTADDEAVKIAIMKKKAQPNALETSLKTLIDTLAKMAPADGSKPKVDTPKAWRDSLRNMQAALVRYRDEISPDDETETEAE